MLITPGSNLQTTQINRNSFQIENHRPISRNRKAKKANTVTMKGCNVVTMDTTHRVLQKIQEINRNSFRIIENRRRILGMVRKVTTAREPQRIQSINLNSYKTLDEVILLQHRTLPWLLVPLITTETLAILPIPKLPPPAPYRVRGPDRSSLHVYLDTERENSSVDDILEVMIGNVIAEAGDIGDGIYRIVQEKDDEERLPVHVACLNKVSADVVRFLASKTSRKHSHQGQYGWCLLHISNCYHASTSVIQSLLDKEPETVMRKTTMVLPVSRWRLSSLHRKKSLPSFAFLELTPACRCC